MATDVEGVVDITELRLGLPGDIRAGGLIGLISPEVVLEKNERKRAFSEIEGSDDQNSSTDELGGGKAHEQKVVGWPPVCSYRKKNSFNSTTSSKMYVKVSMDGAPFLRKIDLTSHKGYSHLVLALGNLFACFGIGEALNDADSSELVPIYEDKDGDWMLLGDVPWKMFAETCKRLRIMKRTEAKGIGLSCKKLPEGNQLIKKWMA